MHFEPILRRLPKSVSILYALIVQTTYLKWVLIKINLRWNKRESANVLEKTTLPHYFLLIRIESEMFVSIAKQSSRKIVALRAGATAGRNLATYKSSTGLVGLAVDPNGRETLSKLSGEVLCALQVCLDMWFGLFKNGNVVCSKNSCCNLQCACSFQQKIPDHSDYRKSTEQWFNFIQKVTAEKENVSLKVCKVLFLNCSAIKIRLRSWFSVTVYYYEFTNNSQIIDIEKEIDLGQIEEVIEMAKAELNVVNYYFGT